MYSEIILLICVASLSYMFAGLKYKQEKYQRREKVVKYLEEQLEIGNLKVVNIIDDIRELLGEKLDK